MDGLFYHPCNPVLVISDTRVSSLCLVPSWASFFSVLAPSWAPSWTQTNPQNTKKWSRKAFFFALLFFQWHLNDVQWFSYFFKGSNPFSHRQGRWNMHLPTKQSFHFRGHFGFIFWWFLKLLSTPNPFKSALGGSFGSFWTLIDFRTSCFWLFDDFCVPKGVPGDPQNSRKDLFLNHFASPGALAGARCLSGGDFYWCLLIV